jgi:hypothetical protein
VSWSEAEMSTNGDGLKEGLLRQQAPNPERLAEYRKEVEAMLEHLRRERWWVGLARAVLTALGAIALSFGALALGAFGLYLAAGPGGLAQAWVPALGGLACLLGAAACLRYFTKRNLAGDLLLEVKRLEMRVLELAESQRRLPEK